MFKTLTIYQLTQATGAVLTRLEKGLLEHPFVECPPHSHRSSGFVPPLGEGDIVYATNGGVLFCLRVDEKELPASYIREAIDATVRARGEDAQMSPVDIRVLKEELTQQALPGIPAGIQRRYGYIDKTLGMLFLDVAGDDADLYMDNLKRALGGTPFALLGIADEPCDKFTEWLENPLPLELAGLKLGTDCSLKHAKEGGTSVINWKQDDLQSPEMEAMLDAGKQCCRIGLVHADAEFAITAKLGIRRLILSPDQLINIDDDGNDIPAVFATTVNVVRNILGSLEPLLGGWPKQELLDLGDEMEKQS